MTLNARNYSDTVANSIIVDAGAIYYNVKFENGQFKEGTRLGATQGGNEFLLETEIRSIAVDGVKGRAKGLNVLENAIPKLKVNLLETSAKNLSLALAGSSIDTQTDEDYDIIEAFNCIQDDAYLDNIALVGKIGAGCQGAGKPIIIVVENALQIDSVSMKTTDKGEVVIPLTFEGTYSEEQVLNNKQPYKIYYPKGQVIVAPGETEEP